MSELPIEKLNNIHNRLLVCISKMQVIAIAMSWIVQSIIPRQLLNLLYFSYLAT